MIWTDLIEEFPEDGYIHPLHEGKGHDGRKYRPVWHAVESTKGMDHKIVTDGGRDASVVGQIPQDNPFRETIRDLREEGKSWEDVWEQMEGAYNPVDRAAFEETTA